MLYLKPKKRHLFEKNIQSLDMYKYLFDLGRIKIFLSSKDQPRLKEVPANAVTPRGHSDKFSKLFDLDIEVTSNPDKLIKS